MQKRDCPKEMDCINIHFATAPLNIIDDVFPNVSTSLTKDELLDLAKNIFDYNLGNNSGFPYAYTLSEHPTKGSIIVPADLAGNVSALHKFLFETDNYTPTQSVQNISAKIQAETGVGAMPIDLTPILGQ